MTCKKNPLKDFEERLNYSFGNEDYRSEKKALQIEPKSHVLCITASGDRPLNQLISPCERLVAVDSNSLQNNLLYLKKAAMEALNEEDYLALLGARPSKNRQILLKKLEPFLPPSVVAFWHEHKKMIDQGVLYQGKIERLTKWISYSANLLRPKLNRKLFECSTLEEQRAFLKSQWDTLPLRKCFEFFLSRTLNEIVAIDPGLYSHTPPSLQMGTYVYDRMLECLQHTLAKESILTSLIFQGFVADEGLPPYLKKEGISAIKKNLSALEIRTENVIQFLEDQKPQSFDRFSLSDIASYMPQEAFEKMIAEVYRTAKPNSRFCIRQFSSDHKIPKAYEKYFVRDLELEKTLEKEDHCFVYRFLVGEIKTA